MRRAACGERARQIGRHARAIAEHDPDEQRALRRGDEKLQRTRERRARHVERDRVRWKERDRHERVREERRHRRGRRQPHRTAPTNAGHGERGQADRDHDRDETTERGVGAQEERDGDD